MTNETGSGEGNTPTRRFGVIDGLAAPLSGSSYDALSRRVAGGGGRTNPITIAADYGRAVQYTRSADRAGFAGYLRTLIERLAATGAEFAAVAAVAPHICGVELQAISPIPFIDLVDVLQTHLQAASVRRVALLSTPVVMRSRLFGRLADIEVVELRPAETDRINQIHSEMMRGGTPGRDSADWLGRLVDDLHAGRGVEAVIVGATELSVPLAAARTSAPVVDCIQLHLDELIRRATA